MLRLQFFDPRRDGRRPRRPARRAALAAGLRAAGRAGARVILADKDFRMGGRLNAETLEISGGAGADWAARAVAELVGELLAHEQAMGEAAKAIELTLEWVTQRKAFGAALWDKQAIRHRLAMLTARIRGETPPDFWSGWLKLKAEYEPRIPA